MLLARCDILVGKFTSTLFRTAYALSSTTRDGWGDNIDDVEDDASPQTVCLKPFVSLDSPWCGDAGVRAGRGARGVLFEC